MYNFILKMIFSRMIERLFILFVMILKLKKQVCSHEQENILTNPQTMKAQTKSMNFGKSIKLKAQMLQQPHGIKERINGVTQALKVQEVTNPIQKMRLKKRASFDEEDLSFKSKMVRFEDEENNQDNKSLQNSRNTKKNSILKKSPSIDQLSVNSVTSDLGAIDFFPNKNSLRNQQGVCSNEKYDKTLKMLKYDNVKFVDSLFPPGMASLCYSKPKTAQFTNIRWMRLQEIYKNKKLVLYSQNLSRKCLVQKGYLNYFDNMSTAFNALSNSKRCLQRVLEQQKVFGLCIYFLRINHDGVWKYVIVDDYIPVIKTKEGDVPAFLNVQQNQFGEIQIWPFLAQKALAKIYNCYQCLFEDTIENIIFEFTGVQPEQLDLRVDTNQFKFRSSVLHSQSIILANNSIKPNSPSNLSYALRQDCQLNSNTYFNLDIRLRIIDANKDKNVVVDLGEICKLFQKVKIFRIDDSIFSLGCIIKQAKDTVSLRRFTVKQRACQCTLTLIQKDKKYYRNNGYEYVWGRLMVMTRDGSNGYRWIAGKYDKQRIVTVQCVLQPGQYFVLITGDWKNRAYEMVLNYQGTQMIQFSRQTLQKHPKIITETCVDMAQRFGVFKQINRNLCAYRLIDKVNGFIIQNVNNQAGRQVFFHKIYSLPRQDKNYELLQRKLYYQQDENEIQILIQANSHFNFVVKLIDGFNTRLANFSFD